MRLFLVALVLFASFSMAVRSVASAQAADAPHGEAAPEEERGKDAHGKKEGGLFEQALDLAIWTISVFVLLIAILGRFAWGPMMEGLKKREENILSAIEDARKAREEALKMREQLTAEIAKAHEEQRKIVEEAHKNAQRAADEIVANARTEIAAERDRLRREIHLAQDQALQQIWQQAAFLATEISSKTIQRQMSPDDHRRLVDDAMKEIQAAGNGHKA